jgi:hypothetical protein
MKQFSTGTGVAVLGVCILAATVVATQRGGSEAFAQGTGGDRRIVAQGVYSAAEWSQQTDRHFGYRIWSDNSTEVKCLGTTNWSIAPDGTYLLLVNQDGTSTWPSGAWQVVDNGTPSFMPTDIDRTGQVDSGDVAQVLLDFNQTTDPTTPPPIDCNINAPR